jgi:hypothetical protein
MWGTGMSDPLAPHFGQMPWNRFLLTELNLPSLKACGLTDLNAGLETATPATWSSEQ